MSLCKEVIEKGNYTLIISEKPKAAKAIAEALSYKPISCKDNNITYYVINNNEKTTVIASTAGHLFTLSTNSKDYPVFDYEWVPRWLVEKGAFHLKKYYYLLSKLSKRASEYVNACDYDIEGSVIGYMIIKLLGNETKGKRMKFSTLTKEELLNSFKKIGPFDYDMIEAGICRHELDWIWGINTSRALMHIYKQASGKNIVLSSGRVQSPALIEVFDRYIEERSFFSPPKFQLTAVFSKDSYKFSSSHISSPFEYKKDAEEAKKRALNVKRGNVSDIKEEKERIPPPPPFNLSDLQYEASRIYGFSPSYTQKIAEDLYLDVLISYPRTNSQKLPPSIPHKNILENLSVLKEYEKQIEEVKKRNPSYIPRQGRKEDPAHPAIYPTGKIPKDLKGDKLKLYDLIVRKYISTFMDDLVLIKRRVKINVGERDVFETNGTIIESKGWFKAYKFYTIEKAIPSLKLNDIVSIESIKIASYYPSKPKLHTKTSLLKWMESQNIGTEATRAQIIETLFKRGYLKSTSKGIIPTKLGIAVSLALKKYVSELTDVSLTRSFEVRLQEIRENKKSRSDVVKEAREVMSKIISQMKAQNEKIGKELMLYSNTPKDKRCILCELPGEVNGLCIIHYSALKKLSEGLEEWMKKTGEDKETSISKIEKNKSLGQAVREVASAIKNKTIILI
ncbi:DNA topoisomerase I [Fervidicoccus fontis]|uniref:DNA topoisomerase n=1 Tax=Fervidicoccus fontis TaxID=683846 RepID=A0A2J6N7Q5_9CREN|nr:DNA topoisomerase I [Fervidicoccus fontis]PMB75470.1 MAG: DNA topoisomerase I [Fervidicoccus fontis]PMB77335.1 MAG: DNA topoisomerase I [Fervidicoccus fontis]HEW64061.1 DNA topoisomerase I [Fervidicoccus fontis]